MLIWGWRTFVTRLAVFFAVCGHCRHEGAQTVDERRTKFTLFFIPLFTTSTKYVQQCTLCAARTLVSKEFADSVAGRPNTAPPHNTAPRGRDALVQIAVHPDELRTGGHRQFPVETGVRCERCAGWGGSGSTPCSTCAGQGRVRATRTVGAGIPAGAQYGARLRLANEGEVGPNGGPPGDIYVELVPPSGAPSR
ncbi:DnaJ C-terminal domain-containing protein [Antrihabitans cavernicola]|uniref:Zinc-ribbon domain-containing protein n=1 Tax=Antrihabitans cavernicola TaxID=2495913 RepID=A0A5A7S6B7_9NOCA|nr:DnaJ C-terminal domain-containing protein [Spelaeibacter cavernicola]KAA0021034.1 zinc-ribbon domain-containing protein [Spelaeibacter cavernicola]